MRVAFTVRMLESDYRRLKVRAAEHGLSMQDCVDSALLEFLGKAPGPRPVHGADCPLAGASREESARVRVFISALRAGDSLARFLVGGLHKLHLVVGLILLGVPYRSIVETVCL